MVIGRPGLLPPGPFAAWLGRQIAERSYDPKQPKAGGGTDALARQLGVSSRLLTKVLGGTGLGRGDSGMVSVATVDRLVTALGQHPRDVYGELYDLPIPEPDWRGGRCELCGEHLREPAELCGFCIAEMAA